MDRVIHILAAPPLCTVQDLGRSGLARFGVPPSGAMDWFALAAANRLVGNPAGAAGLEFALDGLVARVTVDCLIAGAGRGFHLRVGGRPVGLWRAALARRGERVEFVPEVEHGWCYLAAAGGINVPPVMGSRSTYARGGFGGTAGRLVQAGDVLPVLPDLPTDWDRRAGKWLRPEHRLAYKTPAAIPVILGPQEAAFTEEGIQAFLSSEYSVSLISDRMGYRLVGPVVSHRTGADLLSEGMLPGSVQVPADGQPIVMMRDGPTTGGYTKIATVTRLGLAQMAQEMPGRGKVRFIAVTVEEAQAAYRGAWKALEGIGRTGDGS